MAVYKHFKTSIPASSEWYPGNEFEVEYFGSPFYPCPGHKHFTHLNVGESTFGFAGMFHPPANSIIKYRRIERVE